MNPKFHHVALTVKNIDESIEWYEQKLGFKLIHRYTKHNMEIAHIESGGVRIELFNYGNKTEPLPEYRKDLKNDLHVMGTKHLCMEVENLEKIIGDLKAKNVHFETETDTAGFGGKYIFFKDCNGILIELYQA